MKKFLAISVLIVTLVLPTFALRPIMECHNIDATPGIAGGILDWCDDVTCRVCTDMSVPGVTIHTTECWANC